MKVAGIQADIVWEDPAANAGRLGPRIASAAEAGAKLVALPEMFATGFTMSPGAAEHPSGPGTRLLVDSAQRLGVHVFGSLAVRLAPGARPRNLGILASPVGPLRTYAKIHPFTPSGEAEVYAAGDATLTADVEGVRVTFLICYDLRFPELFAALAARTDLFVIVASWPTPRREHWRTLLRARAIECQAYVLGVNRVGQGGGLAYSGDSALWGPDGALEAEAPPGDEGAVTGDVDPVWVADVRGTMPVLRDRRPDLYPRL